MPQPAEIVPRETALSRLEREFESRWERHEIKVLGDSDEAYLVKRVPQNAKACDKKLTRRTSMPRYVGRHGSKHIVRIGSAVGASHLRYVTDAELAALNLVAK